MGKVSPIIWIEGIPQIMGLWIRKRDNITMMIKQEGKNITITCKTKRFDHIGTGIYSIEYGYFDYQIDRTNIKNQCTTTISGKFTADPKNPTKLQVQIIGTDGRCDLKPNYQENDFWDKA